MWTHGQAEADHYQSGNAHYYQTVHAQNVEGQCGSV